MNNTTTITPFPATPATPTTTPFLITNDGNPTPLPPPSNVATTAVVNVTAAIYGGVAEWTNSLGGVLGELERGEGKLHRRRLSGTFPSLSLSLPSKNAVLLLKRRQLGLGQGVPRRKSMKATWREERRNTSRDKNQSKHRGRKANNKTNSLGGSVPPV